MLAAAAARAAAQQVSVPESVSLRVNGRVQVQFNTTSVDTVDGTPLADSEFLIRRARLTFDIRFNDFLSARVEPDYSVILGEGLFSLRDAYVRLTFGPGLRASLGQFKRPFDLFELTSSTQILVAERTGAVRGAGPCGGLTTVCSLSALTEGLLYSDRDVGVMLDGDAVPGRLRYAVALTNGQPQNRRESASGKTVTGRLSLTLFGDVALSANGSYKDYLHPTTQLPAHAGAWGADLEVGSVARGPHMQAGIVGGDDWRVADGTEDVARFLTGQVIAAWQVPVGHRWLAGIEPVARASWGDPSTEQDDDGGWLLTPGVILHLGGRNRLHTNLDVWVPQVGDTEYSFRTQMNFYF